MEERIRRSELKSRVMSAAEAAALIEDGMTVGTSGFTGVGYPKAVPSALAERCEAGENIKIRLITGASTGDELDGVLSRAGCIERRYPYQSNKSLRERINGGEVCYVDMHLGHVPYWIRNNWFGNIDVAIIEASSITEEGYIVPTVSVGISDVLAEHAGKIIVEINTLIPAEIEGFHDIYTLENAPHTKPVGICSPGDRIGTCAIPCDPDKIAAVVFSDRPDTNAELKEANEEQKKIAENVILLLKSEVEKGRLPYPFPPMQSGIGGVANAILSGLLDSDFEDLTIYTEVMQDAVLQLLDSGKLKMATGTALTVSPSKKEYYYNRISRYKDRIILRPQEISNSAEVIRRLSVIAMNTAVEVDISGNVNSTHVGGTQIINGIGGSGDFARNAGLTIFFTASTAKNGTVSCIVPKVTHIDHTEHDVQIIITEQGIADLRGLTAWERAELIINNCAHPKFRDELRDYLNRAECEQGAKHQIP